MNNSKKINKIYWILMTILFILLLSLGVLNLINFTKPKFNVLMIAIQRSLK